ACRQAAVFSPRIHAARTGTGRLLVIHDLESRSLDQTAVDVVLARELRLHAVMLLTPVLRHVVPEVKRRARRPITGLVGGQEAFQRCLRGVDRDDVEAAAAVVRAILGGGLGGIDLQQNVHARPLACYLHYHLSCPSNLTAPASLLASSAAMPPTANTATALSSSPSWFADPSSKRQ